MYCVSINQNHIRIKALRRGNNGREDSKTTTFDFRGKSSNRELTLYAYSLRADFVCVQLAKWLGLLLRAIFKHWLWMRTLFRRWLWMRTLYRRWLSARTPFRRGLYVRTPMWRCQSLAGVKCSPCTSSILQNEWNQKIGERCGTKSKNRRGRSRHQFSIQSLLFIPIQSSFIIQNPSKWYKKSDGKWLQQKQTFTEFT